MSLQSAFNTGFRNFGHAIATIAKYTATGLKELLVVANKAQVIEPEVALVVDALAGPVGDKITNLAFHALGDIAHALEPISADAAGQVSAQGLNVQLDVQTIRDIKIIVPQLKAILAALGGTLPPAVQLVTPTSPVVAKP